MGVFRYPHDWYALGHILKSGVEEAAKFDDAGNHAGDPDPFGEYVALRDENDRALEDYLRHNLVPLGGAGGTPTVPGPAALPATGGVCLNVMANGDLPASGLIYVHDQEGSATNIGTLNAETGAYAANVFNVSAGPVTTLHYDASTNSIIVGSEASNGVWTWYVYSASTYALTQTIASSGLGTYIIGQRVMNGVLYVCSTSSTAGSVTYTVSQWTLGTSTAWTNWTAGLSNNGTRYMSIGADYANNVLYVAQPGIGTNAVAELNPSGQTVTSLSTTPVNNNADPIAGTVANGRFYSWGQNGGWIGQAFNLSTASWESTLYGTTALVSPYNQAANGMAFDRNGSAFLMIEGNANTPYGSQLFQMVIPTTSWTTATTTALSSGTVYQNTSANAIYIYQTIDYAPTSSAAATCDFKLGASSPPADVGTTSYAAAATAVQRVESFFIPSGDYYSLTLTNATFVGNPTTVGV